MLTRMYAEVEFDREIPDTGYISPGGYEAIFKDGRVLAFDFMDSFISYDKNIMSFEQESPDVDSFEDIPKFTYQDFVSHFDHFEEFYLYTGEDDEFEAKPVRVKSLSMEFQEHGHIYTFDVPEEMLPEFGKDGISLAPASEKEDR